MNASSEAWGSRPHS